MRGTTLNTEETLRSPRNLISRISSGLGSGTPGTYQCTDGSSAGASPTQLSRSALTSFLHEPQPVPARVASQSAFKERLSPRAEARIAPLETPLQLQTCASSGISRTPWGPAASAAGKRN